MQKIYSFRKPMSNYQVPQNAMLKFRFVWIYTCMCNIHKLIQQLNYCIVIHASQCMYTLKNKIIMNGLRQYNYTVSVKSFVPCSFIHCINDLSLNQLLSLVFFSFYRFFNEFLMANERHVAREIRDEYLDTMSKIYYSYFKGYLGRLMKLQVRQQIFLIGELFLKVIFMNTIDMVK